MSIVQKRAKVVCLVALLTLVAAVTWADNPHFIRATAALDNDDNLVVSWKEAGLGSNVVVQYTASADATAEFQCVNRGGQCPQASNKQSVEGPVSATGAFSSGKNGQITASLTVEPPASTLVCPGNQHVEVASITYSNISLSDDTNGVTANVTPTSFSVTNTVCP
jgi:hypothetical protein